MRKYAVEAVIKYSELEKNNAIPQRSVYSTTLSSGFPKN